MNQGTHRAEDRSAVIELDSTGSGQVTVGGAVVAINGQGNVDYGRQQARDVVVEHAQTHNVAVEVEVREATQNMRLLVTPAGQVTAAPAPEPVPEPAAAPVPAPEPAAAPVPAPEPAAAPAPASEPAVAPYEEPAVMWAPEPVPAPEGAHDYQQEAVDGGGRPLPHGNGGGHESYGTPGAQRGAASTPTETPREEAPVTAVEPPTEPVAPVDPEWIEEESRPAAEGWRRTVNNFGFKIGPGAEELEERRRAFHERKAAEVERVQQAAAQLTRRHAREEADRSLRSRIQTDLPESVTILVANQKGGQRKTTSTYCLGATFGSIRGGYVVAWDANETMGTLGYRSQKGARSQTVVDLLEDASDRFDTVEGSRFGVLNPYLRSQGDSHFEVLASDEDAKRQDIIGGDEFTKVHEILSRFYRVVLVDTGNNIRTGHLRAALDASDQLVVPVTASRDGVLGARKTMEAFSAAGYGSLVESAVVLLHDLEPAGTADAKYLETVRSIADELAPLVSAVVPVPYDSHLSDGAEIDYAALAESTRASYREAAAAIMDSLAQSYTRSER